MIRLIRAELFKLRTTRMYLGLLVAATGVVVLVTGLQFALGEDSSLTIEGAASVIETEADLRSVLDVSGVAVLFTLILGATALAGEHRHRTIATTFLVTPTRSRVVVAKVAGYTVAGAVFGVGIGAAIPNQLAAVLAGFGWVMLAEQLVGGLVPDLAQWLPFRGAGAAITGLNPEMGAVAGIGLFLAYLFVIVAVAIQVTRRRDIA